MTLIRRVVQTNVTSDNGALTNATLTESEAKSSEPVATASFASELSENSALAHEPKLMVQSATESYQSDNETVHEHGAEESVDIKTSQALTQDSSEEPTASKSKPLKTALRIRDLSEGHPDFLDGCQSQRDIEGTSLVQRPKKSDSTEPSPASLSGSDSPRLTRRVHFDESTDQSFAGLREPIHPIAQHNPFPVLTLGGKFVLCREGVLNADETTTQVETHSMSSGGGMTIIMGDGFYGTQITQAEGQAARARADTLRREAEAIRNRAQADAQAARSRAYKERNNAHAQAQAARAQAARDRAQARAMRRG